MEEAVVVKKEKKFKLEKINFLSFSIRYWKNGRREINIFFHFPQNTGRMEEDQLKKFISHGKQD